MQPPEHSTLELAVCDVDLRSSAPLLARLAARGITCETLAEDQRQQPEWLARFYDLDNATRMHDPQVPRTVEQMRERLAFLNSGIKQPFSARGLHLGLTHHCRERAWSVAACKFLVQSTVGGDSPAHR